MTSEADPLRSETCKVTLSFSCRTGASFSSTSHELRRIEVCLDLTGPPSPVRECVSVTSTHLSPSFSLYTFLHPFGKILGEGPTDPRTLASTRKARGFRNRRQYECPRPSGRWDRWSCRPRQGVLKTVNRTTPPWYLGLTVVLGRRRSLRVEPYFNRDQSCLLGPFRLRSSIRRSPGPVKSPTQTRPRRERVNDDFRRGRVYPAVSSGREVQGNWTPTAALGDQGLL